MVADGPAGSDLPVLDHIVGLSFDYDAEPAPPLFRHGAARMDPRRRRPAPGPARIQRAKTACSTATRWVQSRCRDFLVSARALRRCRCRRRR